MNELEEIIIEQEEVGALHLADLLAYSHEDAAKGNENFKSNFWENT